MVEEIKALKELLDMGAITQEDYDRKKAEILNRPAQPFASSGVAATPTAPQSLQVTAQTQSKSKVAAGLLAIFLGCLGIHKFYLGYTMQGIILLLVTIFGALLLVGPLITAVISFIEGIIYLTKSDEDFQRIYVTGQRGWF